MSLCTRALCMMYNGGERLQIGTLTRKYMDDDVQGAIMR